MPESKFQLRPNPSDIQFDIMAYQVCPLRGMAQTGGNAYYASPVTEATIAKEPLVETEDDVEEGWHDPSDGGVPGVPLPVVHHMSHHPGHTDHNVTAHPA